MPIKKKLPELDAADKKISTALAIISREREIEVPRSIVPIGQTIQPPTISRPPTDIASKGPDPANLARICAVGGWPYFARYIWDFGGWKFVRTVKPDPDDDQRCIVRRTPIAGNFTGIERCPYCFAEGQGAVRCRGGCLRDVCYGKTSKPSSMYVHGYFRCFCGTEGPLQPCCLQYEGITWTVL